MRAMSYNQKTGISLTPVGLGYTVAGAAPYSALTTYGFGTVVTSGGNYYASKQAGNLGNPLNAVPNKWWIQVDSVTGIPVGANYVAIQAENFSLRYTEDGTNPTASVGELVAVSGKGKNVVVILGSGGYPLSNVMLVGWSAPAKSSIANITFYQG